jgi:hypothetical protein
MSVAGLIFFALLAAGRGDNNPNAATTKKMSGSSSSDAIRTEESAKQHPKGAGSLGEIVATMNAYMSQPGQKFIMNYKNGPFAVGEVDSALWDTLSPRTQNALFTRFANLFGAAGGGVNCRVMVDGVEVGHVSTSVFGGWHYDPK